MTWPDKFVSFDTETTGLGNDARIVEIAFVRFEKGEIAENWSSFLNPDGVNWEDANVKKAMEVNQIEKTALAGQPSFMDIFHHIAAHIRSADVLVAHNGEYDLRMLDQEYKAHKGVSFPIQPKLSLCTKVLSYKVHPRERSHNLASTAARWGVQQDGAHRAASDAITCGRILHAMRLKNALPSDFSELEAVSKQANMSWNANKGGGRR